MKKLALVLAAVCAAYALQAASNRPLEPQGAAPASSVAAWEQRAQGITIIRDTWGIPHVYGKTDADAVFGVMYAQAEDDFNRVETNFLNAMGRLAEAEGESAIYRDLRMKLFIDPVEIKAQYEKSPAWLKALMNAWADGLNYYLHTHPAVKPRVITRFEPWMALTFSEGSIGGDIEKVNLGQLEAFYGGGQAKAPAEEPDADFVEPSGSNGVAIAPANTAAGRALLLINPHTSFFFRAEAQMVSEEGLNAYGALTWGQFFIYQGFNDRTGWMHTSSSVDAVDEYAETDSRKGDDCPLPLRHRGAPGEGPGDLGSVQDGGRDGEEGLHRLPHPPRSDRAAGERQVDRHPPDAGAAEGPDAVVRPHEGPEPQGLPRDDGPAHQLVEQHDLRGRRRHDRLLPRQLRSAAQPEVRLDAAGRRQRSGHRVERRAVGGRVAAAREPGERLALQHQQLPVVGGGRRAARRRPTSRSTSTAAARTRAPSTPSGCSTTRRDSRSTRCSPPRTTATCRRSPRQIPALVKAWERLPADDALRAKTAEPIARAPRLGLPVGRQLGAHHARRLLGRGGRALDRRRGPQGGRPGRRLHRDERRARITPRAARDGVRTARPPTSGRGRRRGATSTASSV